LIKLLLTSLFLVACGSADQVNQRHSTWSLQPPIIYSSANGNTWSFDKQKAQPLESLHLDDVLAFAESDSSSVKLQVNTECQLQDQKFRHHVNMQMPTQVSVFQFMPPITWLLSDSKPVCSFAFLAESSSGDTHFFDLQSIAVELNSNLQPAIRVARFGEN